MNVTSNSQHACDVRINVTTFGVEKANTIAIYETNGTVFNGHYQEQERMNVIQLYVNDSGAGTPFVEGPNVIVIPTSLFTETIFNAYVQNETLHEIPIYSTDDDIFKFISVGRDGSTEQACDEIDFIFIRFNISSQDAMEILNLLLECLVNETTNETAIVYSYTSTKINGTLAVMMNLPISVLGFVPWFCDFENSPIGSKPETKKDVFLKTFKKLVSLAVGLIIVIGMAILELVELIAEFVMEILMEWLPILEFILWLILRTIIFILAWIEFAFNLFMMIILLVIITSFMYILSIFINVEISLKIDKVVVNGLFDLTFGYKLSFEHIDFLDLDLPTFKAYFNSSNFAFEYSAGLFSMQFNFSKFPDNPYEELDDDPQQSTKYLPRMNAESTDNNDYIKLRRKCELISAVGTSMGFSSAIIGVLAAAAAFKKDKSMRIIYIIAAFSFVISFSVMILNAFLFSEEFTPWVIWGLGLGLIISGGACLATGLYMALTDYAFMAKAESFFGKEAIYGTLGILDAQIALWGAELNLKDFFNVEELDNPLVDHPYSRAVISLSAGIFSLFIAQQTLIFLGGKYNKDNFGCNIYLGKGEKTAITLLFSGIFLAVGVILMIWSYNLE